MPTYCYRCARCARTREAFAHMHAIPEHLVCECGERMDRDFVAEHGHVRRHPGNWPMASDAAGVNPDQIPEAIAAQKRFGGDVARTEYTADGRPIFTGPGHRKRYCEAFGLFDRNGGYGDPQRRQRAAGDRPARPIADPYRERR